MKLNDPITKIPLVGNSYAKKLEKLDIQKVKDLLLHIPRKYQDYSKITEIVDAQIGDTIVVKGTLINIESHYTKKGKPMQTATIEDKSGEIKVIWFNQTYLTRTLRPQMKIRLAGEVSWFAREKALISPEYEIERGNSVHTGRIVPIYPETAGVSSKWLRSRINKVLEMLKDELQEYLPKKILEKYNLYELSKAYNQIHFPKSIQNAKKARERLAFDELLRLQLISFERKKEWKKNRTQSKLKVNSQIKKNFEALLPFKLTSSQSTVIKEMFKDLQKEVPMNRLLEGDVGSGKTVVAAAACYAALKNGKKCVFMAPTQILAKQHYKTFKKVFRGEKLKTALLTSDNKNTKEADIWIGTHALIHKSADFDETAVVIIDEQHRFGVEQRNHLIKKTAGKSFAPHVLTMTATPIPRTVAMSVYGDLDLSVLEELPKERKPITTWIVPPKKRDPAYEWIREKIEKEDVQVFVVCPLIEESESETMDGVKSAKKEYQKLKKVFSKKNVGLLHGKLKPQEKDKAISEFKKGVIDILVATPVIEVGIDVPNASIMLIEAAERFGLAQLHQLRGRVGRGKKKSYCLLFTDSKTTKVQNRLSALKRIKNGFELAELDLKLRGPGEIFGVRQHGFPELKIAKWQDFEIIKKSRSLALEISQDPDKYSEISAYFSSVFQIY